MSGASKARFRFNYERVEGILAGVLEDGGYSSSDIVLMLDDLLADQGGWKGCGDEEPTLRRFLVAMLDAQVFESQCLDWRLAHATALRLRELQESGLPERAQSAVMAPDRLDVASRLAAYFAPIDAAFAWMRRDPMLIQRCFAAVYAPTSGSHDCDDFRKELKSLMDRHNVMEVIAVRRRS